MKRLSGENRPWLSLKRVLRYGAGWRSPGLPGARGSTHKSWGALPTLGPIPTENSRKRPSRDQSSTDLSSLDWNRSSSLTAPLATFRYRLVTEPSRSDEKMMLRTYGDQVAVLAEAESKVS